ncbi:MULTISPECIES: amidase [Agrobacterium]|uniref:Amidase n=1 Tax=Agrobacterium rubi TaxID=28099 RepID=A0AAE7UTD4_9HYPH|nr:MULTISPECIES: amidase [Agrobacterium]MBN7807829.1 amidase [Agrobacterium rosae]NTE89789.1 amidase [Agrobacterium rubi]NTF05361.1 amidase [Agrobacterium rubi]NTF10483.1 amidase [Agrobacterium rubi]NTF22877.1 amidase [Agrobacterium rubi]
MTEMLSIAEASRLIEAKKVSPLELAQDALTKIDRENERLKAFVLVTHERAIIDAQASETRQMRGELRGRLDGIPIAHKDIIDVADIPTTCQSRITDGRPASTDATSVRKLMDAGTTMMGKLATHEFAMGGPSFDLPWEPPRNPWDTERYAAGSSSGTGVAIAAGMIMGGTGTDTGGSIRLPSTLCGVTGLKPTFGLVSRAGVVPLSHSLDHVGPMAWTVEDCALLLETMAGPDLADPYNSGRHSRRYAASLNRNISGKKIGVVRNFHEDQPLTVPMSDALREVEATLSDLGAEVLDIRLPPLQDYAACGWVIHLVESFALHEHMLRTRWHAYGKEMRERVALGAFISGADFQQALRMRGDLIVAMRQGLDGLDALLIAGTAGEAAKFTELARWPFLGSASYTMPMDVTGFPAIAVRAGFGPNGMPLGVQFVGRPFQEQGILDIAYAYEQASQWKDRRPAA